MNRMRARLAAVAVLALALCPSPQALATERARPPVPPPPPARPVPPSPAPVNPLGGMGMPLPSGPALALDNTFAETGFGYTIRYPGTWVASRVAEFSVVFAGQPGTPTYHTTVAVENRQSPNPGEPQRGAAALMERYLTEVKAKSKDIEVRRQAPFAFGRDSEQGFQAVVDFSGQTERMRQWAVFLPRRSGRVIHVWMYTAPVMAFDMGLPTARAMLNSWTIARADNSPAGR